MKISLNFFFLKFEKSSKENQPQQSYFILMFQLAINHKEKKIGSLGQTCELCTISNSWEKSYLQIFLKKISSNKLRDG